MSLHLYCARAYEGTPTSVLNISFRVVLFVFIFFTLDCCIVLQVDEKDVLARLIPPMMDRSDQILPYDCTVLKLVVNSFPCLPSFSQMAREDGSKADPTEGAKGESPAKVRGRTGEPETRIDTGV